MKQGGNGKVKNVGQFTGGAKPKTTMIDRRITKKANKTGKTSEMAESGGKHG